MIPGAHYPPKYLQNKTGYTKSKHCVFYCGMASTRLSELHNTNVLIYILTSQNVDLKPIRIKLCFHNKLFTQAFRKVTVHRYDMFKRNETDGWFLPAVQREGFSFSKSIQNFWLWRFFYSYSRGVFGRKELNVWLECIRRNLSLLEKEICIILKTEMPPSQLLWNFKRWYSVWSGWILGGAVSPLCTYSNP